MLTFSCGNPLVREMKIEPVSFAESHQSEPQRCKTKFEAQLFAACTAKVWFPGEFCSLLNYRYG